MKNDSNNFVYDLAVIGNGIAAKTFLRLLSKKELGKELERKSQNFSIAQIYDEKLAPSCSLRASVTVSLNGIRSDVSELGNQLRDGYFAFKEQFENFSPRGVHSVERVVCASDDLENKKLIRRYASTDNIDHKLLKSPLKGVTYPAFIVNPTEYLDWVSEQIKLSHLDQFEEFVSDIKKNEDYYEITLKDKRVIRSQKLLLCAGAFSKLYAHFFDLHKELLAQEEINLEGPNQIKAGSFLSREINLGLDPFYLVIDGNKVLYYKDLEKKYHLSVATVTTLGPNASFDAEAFSHIFNLFKTHSTIPLGEMSDYKFTCGLRHKGPRRVTIAQKVESQKFRDLYLLNGLYKNGFTLSFLGAQKVLDEMFK